MNYRIRKKIKVIESDTAQEFEKEFNAAFEELARWKPEMTLNTQRGTHCAYITYAEEVMVPEDIRDEYELRGIRYICGDCPWFRPSPDMRVKYTTCERGQYRTSYNKDACVALYEAVDRGEVEI